MHNTCSVSEPHCRIEFDVSCESLGIMLLEFKGALAELLRINT